MLNGMIKVVSLDVDGTLVTPDFTDAVWYEGIPHLLAKHKGMTYAEARNFVEAEYRAVGDQRLEWYDIKWWFDHFKLSGHREMMSQFTNRIALYPEVEEVLDALAGRYVLVIGSASTREFLPFTLAHLEKRFDRVFSSITDYQEVKTPAFYLRICGEMGIKLGELVHAGDHRQLDYENPTSAGVRAFHIDRTGGAGNGALPDLRALVSRLAELSPGV
jgi:putative hydrolase of the HAD superfamily